MNELYLLVILAKEMPRLVQPTYLNMISHVVVSVCWLVGTLEVGEASPNLICSLSLLSGWFSGCVYVDVLYFTIYNYTTYFHSYILLFGVVVVHV